MQLHVLPPEVVSRIAAGEVVERPASIVKELVENALDAGARTIDIECRGGGAELICVADNGAGIPAAHVETAFLRHATSKIESLDDLVHVKTLGFRGEALPSIAAVADVEVSTRTAEEESGSYLYLHGGQVAQHERRARARGTTIAVRRLFRHFPARLKFLKSENTENGHSAQVVSQYALAFPSVAFSLMLEDRLALRTPGNGDLRDVVTQLYGAEMARAMVRVEHSADTFVITGLAAPASLSRAGRSGQGTFVNQRWIRSPLLNKAIDDAYHGLLQEGRNGIAVINIQMPPDRVDVNVHPSKAQVKFADEQAVYRTVRDAVRQALEQTRVATELHHLPYSGEGTQAAWSIGEPEAHASSPLVISPPTEGGVSLPPLRVLGEVLTTYIVAEGPDGLYLIDQHAAHERVVYETLTARGTEEAADAQGLLEPVPVELSPAEDAVLGTVRDEMARLGFSLEHFGDRTYLLRAVPAEVPGAHAASMLHDLLHELSGVGRTDVFERLAITVACHSAVRAGKRLTPEEMRQLIRQLERCAQPRTCPHGRPTVVRFDPGQLERLFGRRT
ncbi:MAG: DNA mismatch repair endonuclease MutL [Dehalococcoidia bacterium]|nr:DNA mismatch repair endonuclease MutL [Dehalococcoidia bacterium]